MVNISDGTPWCIPFKNNHVAMAMINAPLCCEKYSSQNGGSATVSIQDTFENYSKQKHRFGRYRRPSPGALEFQH